MLYTPTEARSLRHVGITTADICSKTYCSQCIDAWIIKKQMHECPYCKQYFNKVVPLHSSSTYTANLKTAIDDKLKLIDQRPDAIFKIFKLFNFYEDKESKLDLGVPVFSGINKVLEKTSLEDFNHKFLFGEEELGSESKPIEQKAKRLNSTSVRKVGSTLSKSLYELTRARHECICLQKIDNEKCNNEEPCRAYNGVLVDLEKTFLLSMFYNLLAEIDQLQLHEEDTTQKVEELILSKLFSCFESITYFDELDKTYELKLSDKISSYNKFAIKRVANYYKTIRGRQTTYLKFCHKYGTFDIGRFIKILDSSCERSLRLASMLPRELKKEFVEADNPLIGYMLVPIQTLSSTFIFSDLEKCKWHDKMLSKVIGYARTSLVYVNDCKDVLADDFVHMYGCHLYMLNIRASLVKTPLTKSIENSISLFDKSSIHSDGHLSLEASDKKILIEAQDYLNKTCIKGEASSYLIGMYRVCIIEHGSHDEFDRKRLERLNKLQCEFFQKFIITFPNEFPIVFRCVKTILKEIDSNTISLENFGLDSSALKGIFSSFIDIMEKNRKEIFLSKKSQETPTNMKRTNSSTF